MLQTSLSVEVANHNHSNQRCTIALCLNLLNLSNLYRRNVSKSLSQVFQPQKVAEAPKSICHSIDNIKV